MAALPARIAAGIEEAFDTELELADQNFCWLDTARRCRRITDRKNEEDWREHVHRIGMKKALLGFVDLTRAEYEALHDANTDEGVNTGIGQRFVVERWAGPGSRFSRRRRRILSLCALNFGRWSSGLRSRSGLR